jgi:hypothetical protein
MAREEPLVRSDGWPLRSGSGGRTWWAHFEFTRINIEPIIPRNKIEDLREAKENGAAQTLGTARLTGWR